MSYMEQLRYEPVNPEEFSKSRALVNDRKRLKKTLEAFKDDHQTPYGMLYVENGRGQRLQEQESFIPFGWQWNMSPPFVLVSDEHTQGTSDSQYTTT